MAEGGLNYISNGSIKEKLLTCSMCCSRYQTPKILPCLHTFCWDCLDIHIKKSKKDTAFPCPSCHKSITIPNNGSKALKTNFFINNLVDIFPDNLLSHKCSVCSLSRLTEMASSKCLNCSDYLCQSCADVHRRTRQTINHKVIPLMQLRSAEILGSTKTKTTFPCSDHPEENVRYYCAACEKPICGDCKALDHQEHKCITFEDAIKERKSKLKENIASLQSQMKTSEDRLARLESDSDKVGQNHGLYVGQIEKFCESLVKTLLDLKVHTIRAIESRTSEVRMKVNSDIGEVNVKYSQLKDLKEYISALVEVGADVEVLDIFRMVKDQVTYLCRGKSGQPEDLVKYGKDNDQSLKQFLKDSENSFSDLCREIVSEISFADEVVSSMGRRQHRK